MLHVKHFHALYPKIPLDYTYNTCYTYNMDKITSQQFQRHFGRYQDEALQRPIAITRHGRPQLVVMSVSTYQSLRQKGRQTMHVSELTDMELAAIESAEVPPEHNHLNHELDDE